MPEITFDDLVPPQPAAPGGEGLSFDDLPSKAPVRGTEPKPRWLTSLLQGIGQGISLGWGDEIMAAIKTGAGMWGDYGAEVGNQRGGLDRAREANPGTFLAGELAGSLPTALFPLGVAARGVSLAGKIGRGVTAGGIQGGIAGAGYGEGEEKPASALIGAGLGMFVGGGAPVAGRVMGPAFGKLMPGGRPGRMSPALENVSRAWNADAVDLASAPRLGREEMLLDLGPNLQQQAGAIAALPGDGQRIIREAMADRTVGAGDRVRSVLERTVGPEPDIPQTAADIAARRNAAAAQNYPRAYATPTDMTPAMKAALDTPAGQSAIRRARTLAQNNMEDFDPANLDTRALHYVGQALGDMIRAAKPGTAQQRAYTRLQRVIYDDMEAQNLPFKQAQAAYAEPSSVAEALTAGQQVFSRVMSPRELYNTLARMTPAEREAFQKGARDQISEIMGTARNDAGAAYRELAEKGWNREKLTILIGRDKADELIEGLFRERAFANSANNVTRNSESARRLTGVGDIATRSRGPGPVAQAYAAGGFMGLFRGMAVKGADKALSSMEPGELDRIATEMAGILTSNGPQRNAVIQTLEQLRTAQFKSQVAADRAARIWRGVLGGLGAAGQPVIGEMRRD